MMNRCPVLKLGSWSVRTKTPGLSDDLQVISDAGKTAVINDELLRLQVDIAALQETRQVDSGTLKEKDYTFFWQGKSSQDRGEHGVGFTIRNTLLKMVETGDRGSEHLMTLLLHTSVGPVTLVSVCAPTLTSTVEAKDEFYANLSEVALSRTHHPRNTSSSLATTMPEWVLTTTSGLPVSDTSELARSTRTDSACWNSAPTTASA